MEKSIIYRGLIPNFLKEIILYNIIIKMFNIPEMPTYIQRIPNQLDRDECSAFTFYGTESQVNVIKTDFWAKYLIFREIDEYSYFFT